MGHVSLVYINDGISGAHDRVSARAASLIERRDLVASGLKCNEGKSNYWEPRQVGEWLGYVIDTILMIFQVHVHKIGKLKAAICAVLNCQLVPVRGIVRIAGYLISMNIALGPIARLFTRHMYFAIAFRRSWHDYVYVSEQLSQELKFCLQCVDAFNDYSK